MSVLKLKNYRLKAKMSQRDVAEALQISQPSYWAWEKGESFPSGESILKLCELFKCSPNDLFGFKGVYKIVGSKLDSDSYE